MYVYIDEAIIENVWAIMNYFKISLWLILAAAALGLVSCDPLSSVDYKMYNKTNDTVTVTMHKAILASAYGGYDIEENDSVVSHCGEDDSTNVAILAPDQVLSVHREWSGLYREELVVPLWKYITSVKAGELEVAPGQWNQESVWHLKTDGGKRFQGESRHYTLILH